MSFEKDPPPLADASSEAPESLRALLRSAKSDLPTSAELASLEAKLGPLLSGGAAAPPAAPAASGMSAAGKAGLAALGGLLVAGGVYLALEPAEQTPPAAPPPSVQSDAPARPSAEPPPAAVPPTPAATPAEPEAAAKPSTESAPPARAEKAARPSPVPEDQLLERARRALASDPNRALALTREHARTYPKGVLAQEREVIAIEALKRLGRTDEADSRRGTFEQRYPQSAHRRNLDGTTKSDAGK